MAQLINTTTYTKFDLPKGYQRTGAFALDPSSIFSSLADAQLYAAGGADARGLGATSYVGQIIAVVENDIVTPYIIKADSTLAAIGGDVAADLSTLQQQVTNILTGSDENFNSFEDIANRFTTLTDLVVKTGEVRTATPEEIAASAGTPLVLVAGETYIVLTIADADSTDGQKNIFIPATSLIDVYTGGTGITVTGNTISADVATITAGLATTTALAAVEAKADAAQAAANAAQGTASAAGEKADGNATDITALANIIGVDRGEDGQFNTADDTVTGGIKQDISDLQAAIANIEHPVESVSEAADCGVSLVLDENKQLKVTVDQTALNAVINHPTVDVPVKSVNETAVSGISLNLSDAGELSLTGAVVHPVDTTNTVTIAATIGSYAEGSALQAALVDMNNRITANANSITAAVAGGVTAISAGNGIKVDATTATQPIVSVKAADSSAIQVTSDGVDVKLAANSAIRKDEQSGALDLVWEEI